ncbi:hypothetical protein GA0070613_5641 [Micromonospora inositola]|uniref:Uncharacterized protein n=1 Tax=Micromonospora inositola TaxID=47865 RepID=A0A1C5JWL1_9ACTN|nr:hypothetical protein GA0070613_5641 [Micromonospora inositola]
MLCRHLHAHAGLATRRLSVGAANAPGPGRRAAAVPRAWRTTTVVRRMGRTRFRTAECGPVQQVAGNLKVADAARGGQQHLLPAADGDRRESGVPLLLIRLRRLPLHYRITFSPGDQLYCRAGDRDGVADWAAGGRVKELDPPGAPEHLGGVGAPKGGAAVVCQQSDPLPVGAPGPGPLHGVWVGGQTGWQQPRQGVSCCSLVHCATGSTQIHLYWRQSISDLTGQPRPRHGGTPAGMLSAWPTSFQRRAHPHRS